MGTNLERFRTVDGFHDHVRYKFVDQDDYKIGRKSDLIGTDGVGTCLVITLYDRRRKMGMLAHISGFSTAPEEMRPEKVIDTLLHALYISGDSGLQDLEATLSGEGYILVGSRRKSPIVRKKLQESGIKIVGEDLDQGPARLVFLHCDTGVVEIYRT